MTALDVLAVAVVFAAGVIAGMIALVSVASRREDRGRHLDPAAPDRFTTAGRYLTRLSIRRPAHPTGPPAELPGEPFGTGSAP
jgi:hypothetical protein